MTTFNAEIIYTTISNGKFYHVAEIEGDEPMPTHENILAILDTEFQQNAGYFTHMEGRYCPPGVTAQTADEKGPCLVQSAAISVISVGTVWRAAVKGE